ncbi:hypothetical protein POVWA2_053370 [Plasmodium ovale wallikeri]|uniref:Uncharacterized protein n=1 Tax=Plasmodium ovale wallikeri TaxID=864142 RepID=A0A1A8ZT89_PLAOA|nr:hypothetical protein POVWA2_053370 [Plasmodium ovale wallikeri]
MDNELDENYETSEELNDENANNVENEEEAKDEENEEEANDVENEEEANKAESENDENVTKSDELSELNQNNSSDQSMNTVSSANELKNIQDSFNFTFNESLFTPPKVNFPKIIVISFISAQNNTITIYIFIFPFFFFFFSLPVLPTLHDEGSRGSIFGTCNEKSSKKEFPVLLHIEHADKKIYIIRKAYIKI